MSKNQERDLMAEPEGGWLHDNNALAVGEGLFYSFPITFVGHVVVKDSLTKLSDDDRTLAIRVMMRRLLREAGALKSPEKKPLTKQMEKFTSGESTLAMLPVTLGISAAGLIVSPNIEPEMMGELGLDKDTVLIQNKMKRVSLAAGGIGSTYDLVAYVAKDREKRACYVFDCGSLTDEVFSTLGQAFLLAQDLATNKIKKPDLSDIEVSGYLDVAPEVEDPAIVKMMEQKLEEIQLSQPNEEFESVYGKVEESAQTKGISIPPESVYASPLYTPMEVPAKPKQTQPLPPISSEPVYETPSEVVDTLNKVDTIRRAKAQKSVNTYKLQPISEDTSKEELKLERVDTKQHVRPTWVCISETANTPTPGAMSTLLRNFKLRAVIEEIISEDEDE